MKLTILLTAAAAVVGCGQRNPTAQELDVARMQRLAAVEERLRKPIPMVTQKVGPHEILTIDVPTRSILPEYVQVVRCFVWRDAEFRTATMQCSREAGADLGQE